jgi:hypothetical protein
MFFVVMLFCKNTFLKSKLLHFIQTVSEIMVSKELSKTKSLLSSFVNEALGVILQLDYCDQL